MWCNCINSLSHISGLEADHSQGESVSVWPVNLNPQIPTFVMSVSCESFMLTFNKKEKKEKKKAVFAEFISLVIFGVSFFQAAGLWKWTFSQMALAVYIWLIYSKLSRLNLISLSAFCVEPSMISPDVSSPSGVSLGSLGLLKECFSKHFCIFTRLDHGNSPASIPPLFPHFIAFLASSFIQISLSFVRGESSVEWTGVERFFSEQESYSHTLYLYFIQVSSFIRCSSNPPAMNRTLLSWW